jgi:hypothetical protein
MLAEDDEIRECSMAALRANYGFVSGTNGMRVVVDFIEMIVHCCD